MDKDTLVAVNGTSLLFSTGVAHISEQNLSERKERAFELPRDAEEKSGEFEQEVPNEAGKLPSRLTLSYISTVEQFLTFKNIG